MKKKLTISIAATLAAIITSACALAAIASAEADSCGAVTTTAALPISAESIEWLSDDAEELYLSGEDFFADNSPKEYYPPEEITITHNPITPEFIALQDACSGLYASNEKSIMQRGATIPNVHHNFVNGSYYGSGRYQRDPIYSEKLFLPNVNNQLHISGNVKLAATSTKSLLIQVVNDTDGSVTDCSIPATAISQSPFYTAYYFDFYIGPLNSGHSYYLKFNTVEWDNIHSVNFTVSHS